MKLGEDSVELLVGGQQELQMRGRNSRVRFGEMGRNHGTDLFKSLECVKGPTGLGFLSAAAGTVGLVIRSDGKTLSWMGEGRGAASGVFEGAGP